MPSASLTRRISFSAAHRYSRPERSDDKTGFVVDLGVLDRILKEQVKDRFDHRNINLDVPEFADGKLVPTGENLARHIFERVEKELPKPVKVMRVTVGEDDSLSATYSRE